MQVEAVANMSKKKTGALACGVQKIVFCGVPGGGTSNNVKILHC